MATKKVQNKNKQVKTSAKESIQNKPVSLSGIKHLDWILAALYFVIMLLISFKYHKIGDYGIESDFFGAYVPQAMKIGKGIFVIDLYKGPVYPLFLYLINLVFGNYFVTGIFIGVASASLVIYFVFNIIRKLFNPLVALITTLLMAVNTTFHLYTYSAGTDMFFFFLASGALYFLFRNTEYKWLNLVIAGLFAGLAYITRYNGIFLVVAILSSVLFINLYKTSWAKRLIATSLFLATFIVIISPWGFYTHKEKGKAFFNQNYQNVAYEFIEKNNGVGWDEYWYGGVREKYSSLSEVIFEEPGAFFKQFFANGFDHLGKDLSSLLGWHISIFSLLGLLLLFSKPPTKQQWSFYLASMLFFGVLLLVFYSERFSLFLIPFYCVFAVNTLFTENKYIKDTIVKSKALVIIIAGILIIWTFSNSYSYNSENINAGDKNLLKLKEQFDKVEPVGQRGDKIMARKAHIAYYLGLEKPWISYANNYYEQLAILLRSGVDYVSYGIWEMGRGLNFLQDPNKLPPHFELIAYSNQRNKVITKKEDNNQTYKIDVKRRQEYALLYKIKIDSAERQIVQAGDWLNEHYSFKDNPEVKNEKIMAALPLLSFYSNRQFEEKKPLFPEKLVETLRSMNVKYFYFGKHEASRDLKLAYLLDPTQAPEGLIPVLDLSKDTQYPAVLYEVK
jgi:hypothetical protein